MYLRLFLLFIFIWSSLASLSPSSSSSAFMTGMQASILIQEFFLNSVRSTYLFESSATSYNLFFIFWFARVRWFFSRTFDLLILPWNISYSYIYWHTFLQFYKLIVSLVLIIVVPDTNIRFLSCGPSTKLTPLLQAMSLQAFSRF